MKLCNRYIEIHTEAAGQPGKQRATSSALTSLIFASLNPELRVSWPETTKLKDKPCRISALSSACACVCVCAVCDIIARASLFMSWAAIVTWWYFELLNENIKVTQCSLCNGGVGWWGRARRGVSDSHCHKTPRRLKFTMQPQQKWIDTFISWKWPRRQRHSCVFLVDSKESCRFT